MSIFNPQNPGIDLSELTTVELQVVQNIGNLGDPNADRILFWDDSAGAFAYLTLGTGLSITDTTINVTAGSLDGTGTTDELVYWVDSDTLGALAVATYPSKAEIAFVKGVTSAIQTQLNAKQATITFGTGVQTALGVSIGSAGAPVLFNGALGTPSSGVLTNCTFPTLNQNTTGSAATLTTTRTIWGQNFNGSANVTGDITLGTSSITLTGSIGATGARATKVWTTDLEVSNDITIGGTALATTYLAKAGGTLTGSITLGENTSIALDPAGSADGKYSGITMTAIGGATIAFGDLLYLDAATSRWKLTDADATATGGAVHVAMAVTSSTDGGALTLLLQGNIRADAKFPALTIGACVYLGETAGAIQVAIPTGADNVIRVMGFALTADEIYFNPSQDHQITVA